MTVTLLILLVGLEIKHYIADYLLQPRWLLQGKGSLTAPGGYVHAAIHVVGTVLVLLVAQEPLQVIAILAVAEFVIHYIIDYVKYRYGSVPATTQPTLYWAVHGLDQLLHQLTYVGIIWYALSA